MPDCSRRDLGAALPVPAREASRVVTSASGAMRPVGRAAPIDTLPTSAGLRGGRARRQREYEWRAPLYKSDHFIATKMSIVAPVYDITGVNVVERGGDVAHDDGNGQLG